MVSTQGGLGDTFSGNPVARAAAHAVMETMSVENLRSWAHMIENRMMSAFTDWRASGRYPMLARLTGLGSMRGIEFSDTATATGRGHLQRLLAAARNRGVLLMPSGRHGDTLRLLPPLTIEPALLDDGLDRILLTLDDIAANAA